MVAVATLPLTRGSERDAAFHALMPEPRSVAVDGHFAR